MNSDPFSEQQIRHKVTPADTLLGVALMYEVSLPELKAANKLSTNDIWQRNELIIPRSERPKGFAPREAGMVRAAAERHFSTALQRLTGCDESSAKECVELNGAGGDFQAAVSLMREAVQAAADLQVQLTDVFIYIKMFDGDAHRAIQELRQDVAWERQRISPGEPSGGASSSVRDMVVDSLPRPPAAAEETRLVTPANDEKCGPPPTEIEETKKDR